MTSPPISSVKKTGPLGRLAVGLFFSVFLAMGLGFTYGFFLRPLLLVIEARSWQRTSCEVLTSGLHTDRSSDGTSYRVDVTYRYVAGGRTHSGSRYKFMGGSGPGFRRNSDVVERLQPGTRTECWFDPANPSHSVINRDLTVEYWFALIPLFFVVVGAGGVRMAIRGTWRGNVGIAWPGKLAGAAFTRAQSVAVPATLEPQTTRIKKLGAIIVIALFWNGIVSTFMFGVVTSFRLGGSWLPMLFLLPFLLVGIGLIVLAIYQGLTLTNPRATLTVSAPVVAPGDELTVDWTIAGTLSKLTRFTITLEGREEATYRRGTSTQTDKKVFAKLQVTDKVPGNLAATGSARITIPPETMHSFDAQHNKIIWVLRVHGTIPNWPDSDDEFPLTLSPRR